MKINAIRALVEIISVLIISYLGLVVVSLTLGVYASPLGMLAGVAAALFFIALRKESFRDFGFKSVRVLPSVIVIAALTAFAFLLFIYVEPILAKVTGPIDLSVFSALQGNATLYTTMLIAAWVGAAFGEEVIWRGFVMTRIAQVFSGSAIGWGVAIVAHAALFSLFHAYQGLTGMIEVFLIAMALGVGYLVLNRSLWPLVIAHGIIDTLVVTDFFYGLKYTDMLRGLLS